MLIFLHTFQGANYEWFKPQQIQEKVQFLISKLKLLTHLDQSISILWVNC